MTPADFGPRAPAAAPAPVKPAKTVDPKSIWDDDEAVEEGEDVDDGSDPRKRPECVLWWQHCGCRRFL